MNKIERIEYFSKQSMKALQESKKANDKYNIKAYRKKIKKIKQQFEDEWEEEIKNIVVR